MIERNANAEDVKAAYRLILGREPDAGGLQNYLTHIDNGLSLAGLRQNFLESEEFRQATGFIKPRIVDVAGVSVSIDANEAEFGRHIAEHGGWEPQLVDRLRRELRGGDVFVDIGANVGVMALNAAAAVDPSGRVLAFEPHPDNLKNLIKGIAANDFGNVRVYPFALSDQRARFSLVGSSNGYLMPAGTDTHQALAFRGDEFLADEPRIDFIKIDIEGHEPFALDGLARTIAHHRPRILCEFNPRCLVEHIGRDPEVFAAQLFRLSRRIEAIEHDGRSTMVQDIDGLMSFWQDRNRDAMANRGMPDGLVHLDLLFAVD